MITEKAQNFISEHSSNIALLLKVNDSLDVYHVDDSFETKGHDREYVVGTSARYKYLIKKRKGSPIPPHIEISDLEQLADFLLQEGKQTSVDYESVSQVAEKDTKDESYSSDIISFDEDLFNTGMVTVMEEGKDEEEPVNSFVQEHLDEVEIKEEATPLTSPQANMFDISNRPFVLGRVFIVPIERQTSARVTDYLFHNNNLLSGEGLRGVVDAYFQRQ